MAMTGFFYTFKRPRTALPMGLLKYDPIGMQNLPSPGLLGAACCSIPRWNQAPAKLMSLCSAQEGSLPRVQEKRKINCRQSISAIACTHTTTPYFGLSFSRFDCDDHDDVGPRAAAFGSARSHCIIAQAFTELTDGLPRRCMRLVFTCYHMTHDILEPGKIQYNFINSSRQSSDVVKLSE